jgi:hypothetical protein
MESLVRVFGNGTVTFSELVVLTHQIAAAFQHNWIKLPTAWFYFDAPAGGSNIFLSNVNAQLQVVHWNSWLAANQQHGQSTGPLTWVRWLQRSYYSHFIYWLCPNAYSAAIANRRWLPSP